MVIAPLQPPHALFSHEPHFKQASMQDFVVGRKEVKVARHKHTLRLDRDGSPAH